MTKKIFFTFLSVSCLFFVSCRKSADEKIQEEVPATIKQLIAESEANNPNCVCHPLINQYMWKGENIYVLMIDDVANFAENRVCDWIPGYYDSKGDTFSVGPIGPESYTRFLQQAELIRTVWACK